VCVCVCMKYCVLEIECVCVRDRVCVCVLEIECVCVFVRERGMKPQKIKIFLRNCCQVMQQRSILKHVMHFKKRRQKKFSFELSCIDCI